MPAYTEILFKGVKAYRLTADKYSCIIAPPIGGQVMRLRDEENGIDVFRYSDEVSLEKINEARVLWGLPTLYLPNRFDGGLIKTSDGEYHFPITDHDFGNFLHGWVHDREHEVVSVSAEGDEVRLETSYLSDENDEMYKCMPITFRISYIYTLSADGLKQEIVLENLSDKMLPVSICTHTCISAPISDDGKQDTLRLSVPIEQRCELSDRALPTERLLPLGERDMKYKNGEMPPVLHDINNDMYTAGYNTLDGEPFYGAIITDTETGHMICNEVSKEYKFWNIWNNRGFQGYFCPEPMTAMINSPNLTLPREVSGYAELAKDEKYSCWQRFFTR